MRFFFGPNSAGNPALSETPVPLGPRNRSHCPHAAPLSSTRSHTIRMQHIMTHVMPSLKLYTRRTTLIPMKLSAIFVTAAIAAAADSGSNWPQFRGPAASGVGNGAPPVQWDGEKGDHVLWKTEIPGLGHSSPVIWGDRIFVTSAVPAAGESTLKVGLYGDIKPVEGEGSQTFTVYCLDRKSGKIVWQRAAASGQPKIKRHPKSTHANPTPATDGKTLIVSFGSEGLFAFDLNGKQLWKKDFGVLDSGFYMVA